MFKQCLGRREAKENHVWHWMSPLRIFLTHLRTPKYPSLVYLHLGCPFGKMVERPVQVSFGVISEKRTKMYHSLPMSYGELLLILTQNYEISIIPAKPRRLPFPKGYNLNTRCEYHERVRGHSTENCTTFKDKVQSLIDANLTKFRELVSSHQKC